MDLIEFLRTRLDEQAERARPKTVMLCGPDNTACCTGRSGTGDCHFGGCDTSGEWGEWAKQGATVEEIHEHEWLHSDDRQRHALADADAKRRIIELHRYRDGDDGGPVYGLCDECGATERDGCATLRLLASIYSDHPDYDEGWRP